MESDQFDLPGPGQGQGKKKGRKAEKQKREREQNQEGLPEKVSFQGCGEAYQPCGEGRACGSPEQRAQSGVKEVARQKLQAVWPEARLVGGAR